jgi:hypothetical protein
LFAQRRDLFSQLDLVFFDTTSIYFYGQGGETIGQRGHSKDHRPDLKQMVVGMVLDQKGTRCAVNSGRGTRPTSRAWFRWWSGSERGLASARCVSWRIGE